MRIMTFCLRSKSSNAFPEDAGAVQRIYPNAVCLFDFLDKFAEVGHKVAVNDSDTAEYCSFLQTTLIVPGALDRERAESNRPDVGESNVNTVTLTSPSSSRPHTSSTFREFLHRFIAQLVRSNGSTSFREQNCLTLGYGLKKSDSDVVSRSHSGLECFFVNTLHNIITSPVWLQLASRVGELI